MWRTSCPIIASGWPSSGGIPYLPRRPRREAPADARRALRRLADGDLGRVHAPELAGLGQRASRNLERLTGAVASGALVVAGAMLVMVDGWHRVAGDLLLAVGVLGTVATALGALRRPRA